MEFAVGDKVWLLKWSQTPMSAYIKEIIDDNIAVINWDLGGTSMEPLSNLFRTKEELMEDVKNKSKIQIEKYINSINTVEDLIIFMFHNVVAYAEEYTDYDARHAVIDRAKELLNIDLSEDF